jgi:hypothetical protein
MTAPDFTEAVRMAKEVIQIGIANDKGHEVPIDTMLNTLMGRDMLRKAPAELVEKSKTIPLYFEVLKLSIASFLDEPEGNLPPEAGIWLASFLRGEIMPPKNSAGRKTVGLLHVLIWRAVDNLVDEGVTATRNDESQFNKSACDAVAQALKELGLKPTTFAGVKRVWNGYEKAWNQSQREAQTDNE